MTLNLDPLTEQRIQREIDLGHFTTPAEVIAHAVNLLQAEESSLSEMRERIHQRLELSFQQAERGETYTPEQARQMLAERRVAQPA